MEAPEYLLGLPSLPETQYPTTLVARGLGVLIEN